MANRATVDSDRSHVTPAIDSSGPPLHRANLLTLADRHFSRRWIRRRVEQMAALNERTLQRTVALHIDVRRLDLSLVTTRAHDTVILPLDRLPRSHHPVVTVELAEHGELMRPTTATERSLVLSGLREKWPQLSERSFNRITRLLTEPYREVPRFVRSIKSTSGDAPVFQVVSAIESGTNLTPQQRVDLLADLARWHRRYLLLVEVPRESIARGYAIITIRFVEPIPGPRVFGARVPNRLDARDDRTVFFSARALFSLLRKLVGGSHSLAIRVPVRDATGPAESTHFITEAPHGFRAVDARLIVRYVIADTVAERTYRDDDEIPEIGHVYVDTETLTVRGADFIVSYYAYRTGLVMQGLLASWVLFAIVAFLYARMASSGVQFHWTRDGLDPNISPLILLFPAAIVTLITQRDAHRVASKCFALPRAFLALSVLAALAAAMLLAMRVTPSVGRIGWSVALAVAGGVALRLSLSFMVHSYRVGRFRLWLLRPFWALQDQDRRSRIDELRRSTEPTIGGGHGHERRD